MTFIDNLAARFGYVKADMPGFLVDAADRARYDIPDYSLADRQLKTMQQIAWVQTAASAVANACAVLPFEVVRSVGEEDEGIINHPFEVLLQRPNDMQSRHEFLYGTVLNRLIAGNAYWWLNRTRDGADPLEMVLLPSNRVRVVPGGKVGLVRGYVFDAGMGQDVALEPWEVVHFKSYHPRNMWVGLSPIEALAVDLEKEYNAAKYDAAFYGKDNAKPEHALLIKGVMPGPEWERLRASMKRKHGGTKREMLMLQGASDIELKQMSLSQHDMDFLNGRTFTKQEIFETFAPGLASVLSVNATEANARTGKATLAELALWPLLVSIAEVITNKVLPAYGPGLVGRFEDPRMTDRALTLQEIGTASRFFTIDEIRAEHYQAEPLGDERGDLLVVEVRQGGEQPPTGDGEPGPELERRLLAMGPDMMEDEPEEPMKATPRIVEAEPVEVMRTPEQVVRDELKQWERFTLNRWGKANPRPFEAEHIPAALQGAIEGALEAAESAEDAREVFAGALLWGSYP